MASVYWNKVVVGDLLPALIKPALGRVQIAKFAAASQDYNPLHLDDDLAKAEGYGGVFVHGLLAFGLIEEALTHFADNLRIVSISGTFHKLIWPGDTLSAKGLVRNHEEKAGSHYIDLDVRVENQNQESVLKGTASCILWPSETEEAQHRIKMPPLSAELRHELEQDIKERLGHLKAIEDITKKA